VYRELTFFQERHELLQETKFTFTHWKRFRRA